MTVPTLGFLQMTKEEFLDEVEAQGVELTDREKRAKRVWVEPYERGDQQIAGYWRSGEAAVAFELPSEWIAWAHSEGKYMPDFPDPLSGRRWEPGSVFPGERRMSLRAVEFFKRQGVNEADLERAVKLIEDHSFSHPPTARSRIVDEVKRDTGVGRAIRKISETEEALWAETYKARGADDADFRLYRMGETGSQGVESWTSDSRGAMPEFLTNPSERWTPDTSATMSELRGRGYTLLANDALIDPGFVGESEVLLINFKDIANNDFEPPPPKPQLPLYRVVLGYRHDGDDGGYFDVEVEARGQQEAYRAAQSLLFSSTGKGEDEVSTWAQSYELVRPAPPSWWYTDDEAGSTKGQKVTEWFSERPEYESLPDGRYRFYSAVEGDEPHLRRASQLWATPDAAKAAAEEEGAEKPRVFVADLLPWEINIGDTPTTRADYTISIWHPSRHVYEYGRQPTKSVTRTNAGRVWVEPYVRGDGTHVAGYWKVGGKEDDLPEIVDETLPEDYPYDLPQLLTVANPADDEYLPYGEHEASDVFFTLTRPSQQQTRDVAAQAIGLVERVHSIDASLDHPKLRKIPIISANTGHIRGGTESSGGYFSKQEAHKINVNGVDFTVGGTVVPVGISINHEASISQGMTIIHEIGHYLDDQVLGGGTSFSESAWSNDAGGVEFISGVGDARRLMQAVMKSDAVKSLYDQLHDDREFSAMVTNPDGTQEHIVEKLDHEFVRYLLYPNEMFARAYAQWIGAKTADPDIMDTSRRLSKDDKQLYAQQWGVEDFKPIRREFDRVFRERGMLKPGRRG